jgi:hypothetical protein
MIDLEFLKQYPLSTIVIKDWFHQRMIESFKDPEIAEEFKEFVLEQGMEIDKLAFLINSNPRMLFDVFDENDIVIETLLYPNGEFTIKIGNEATTKSWKTRKEAEHFAVEAAIELLDKKLTPIYFPKIEE